ncbi:carbohydrate esterase family 4 protein [Suillus fuscotomentosus]|uniref:Carbohydrate esterase family 4 protein n=1 Tax=Suillus fuscotomentosus TaxID=1912939 RepID=A0AAD4EL03_9AGAM|nr:carbohydrate esterase family 4 protein [Suillus fuscotomentosus]KAG1908031.1 carbohydrate esterase family 4 protein [Suillus fuscotomentosus]
MTRKIFVGFGVDVDAVAGRLGSYGGEDSPLDISRGMYAGEVGVPRLLKLFDKYKIKTTWFIPGHSLETFPKQMEAVRDAGHEIGLHGYSHENPVTMTLEQQRDILDHTFNLLTDFNHGVPPKGSVAPWWETSKEGTALLLEKGIEYDHSNMCHDSQMYYLRDEDTWTNIDYQAKAHTWMKPLQRGKETGVVEIPANWYLDDLPPMMFIKSSSNSHGWVSAQAVEQLWKDTFTYLYREEKDFVFPISIHPDVSGRPHVLLMLESFIEWINTHDDVQWLTFYDMAQDFRATHDPAPGAIMPKGFEKA